MSRVGKQPVPIPTGVTVTVDDGFVKVKALDQFVARVVDHQQFSRHDNDRRGRARRAGHPDVFDGSRCNGAGWFDHKHLNRDPLRDAGNAGGNARAYSHHFQRH